MVVKNKIQISFFLLVFLMFYLTAPNVLFAHSNLERSYPSSNEKLTVSPDSIEAWFQDPVVIHPESIRLYNERGEKTKIESILLDNNSNKHIVGDLAHPLAQGSYTVKINVLALDGDVIEEEFHFQVKQDGIKENKKSSFMLVKQFPDDGEITSSPPEQIELWFNQPAMVTAIGLFDDKQQVLPLEQPEVDPNDPTHFTINIDKKLENKGTYQVTWYARPVSAKMSQADSLDVFYFAVKEYSPIKRGSGEIPGSKFWFQNIGVKQLSYFFIFSGIMSLFGGTFLYFISGGKDNFKRWKTATIILVVLTLLGEILLISSQLNEIANLSLQQLLSIKFIWMPIVQSLFVTLGLLSKKLDMYYYCLAILMLPFFVGHSFYPRYGGYLTFVLSELHLLAASIWIGGIFALLLTLNQSIEEWIKRTFLFSKWAFISLFIIILTGIWMTISYIPSFSLQGLWDSEWGKSLILKTAITMVVFVIGYFQRKTIRQFTSLRAEPFIKRLRIEALFGLLLLLFASLLVVSFPNSSSGLYLVEGAEEPPIVDFDQMKTGLNELTVKFPKNNIKTIKVSIEMPPNYKADYKAFHVADDMYKITGNLIHSSGITIIRIKAITGGNKELNYHYKVVVPGEMKE
jgi:copper transport protein